MGYKYEISISNKNFIKEHFCNNEFIIELNENKPIFTSDDRKQLEGSVDPFSDLDTSRHCRVAFARISNETLSHGQDNRPSIKSNPTGFPTEDKFKNLIFQRCHLIGYHLFGKRNNEDNNECSNLKRIFTGTCFMNNIMLYRENMIADYVDGTENYVLYRVTPYFDIVNKLAYGVQMEAKFFNKKNKEDENKSFNIFVYNKQPGIDFNYKTAVISRNKSIDMINEISETEHNYVINKKKKKFHLKNCASVHYINEKSEPDKKRDKLVEENYRPCAICDPIIRLDAFKI